ncbi:MAG: glycosyltransferase [Gemmatimonadaceae bacterium]
MRVLFVTHNYPRHAADGAGSFLHRLAVALRAADLDVRVLAPSAEGLAQDDVVDGVPVRRFRYALRGMETLAYTGTMAEQVLGSLRGKGALAGLLAAGSLALHNEIERSNPDVVHAHWWFPGGLLARGGAGDLPLVTTMHGSDVRLARKVSMVHPLFRAVMTRSAAVTAVSSWLAGEARAMAPGTEIAVAPMPADVALFLDVPSARTPGRFLFVGRLNAQKGLADLLEAMAWMPESATLDVVGDGDEAATLRERAECLGVGARVRWLGQVRGAELPGLYRTAQAVVMPSRDEGLGLVAVEAQLCRTPVIAYHSGGLPDVVDASWGGTLVPPGDTRALADAMRTVLDAPARIDGVGAAARARMLERFSPDAVAAVYSGLYREVARHGR